MRIPDKDAGHSLHHFPFPKRIRLQRRVKPLSPMPILISHTQHSGSEDFATVGSQVNTVTQASGRDSLAHPGNQEMDTQLFSPPPHLARLRPHSDSAPPTQPPVPPGANCRCPTEKNLQVTANVFWHPARAAFRAWVGFTLKHRDASQRYHFLWYKGDDGLWCIGKISAGTFFADGACVACLLDDLGPIMLTSSFSAERYTTSTGAVWGS